MTDQETNPPQPSAEETLPQEPVSAEHPEKAEEEIDLNDLFPNEGTDLNELFPEPEMRSLLKSVSRNAKDLDKMKSRFKESFEEDE